MSAGQAMPFGGSGLDRAAHLRGTDATRTGARCIVLWRGQALTVASGLILVPQTHKDLPPSQVFLGLAQGQPLRACDLSDWSAERAAAQPFAEGATFTDLRARMADLTPHDAELWATARALFEWHRMHGFCAACGSASDSAKDGWQRDCPACGRMHFPRTDPAVIMRVTDGDRVLLGRAPSWPEGLYSLLAGFVEPGETMENAVRREVWEEVGIRCGAVSYLASQPWPFPSSLMLGCQAQALGTEITLDPVEIEDARWLDRAALRHSFDGTGETGLLPARPGSIAHILLRNWLAERPA